ncbi:ATP/GTP-binding protein (plasmid) [Streptomyces globosus]|uniref:ATP/GTP-binding protein n=1 Tax=Streptomyces globosus TaxID=68209 RepID=A0A344UAM5_9ACTN|nr:ATP/GTP-binding protein [Streptomyces globosus]AXE27946.1 ATP/GTP-binding protein [Streptomyces globosus]
MADNLRALFSSNDPSAFDVAEAFTDRNHQWAVVAAALEEHLRRVAGGSIDVEDLEAPRTNVIVFHGVGGIGKSTLLRKIEAALTAAEHRPEQWGAPTWTDRVLPIRIDLSRAASTGSDFERVILTIRLALAGALHRTVPSFDVALRHYWEHVHPGEPLDEYVRRSGLAGRFANLLPGQLQAGVGEVAAALALPGLVGSAAGQLTTALVSALRERQERARALAGATRTAALLEATPDLEALSYYPHLLAWDLDQLPAKKRLTPVVLLDTFEDTADRHRDFERLLQRLVWLLPNAFFVIGGRSRLQWADPALHGQLDWTGPTAWPGLAAAPSSLTVPQPRAASSGARQFLIGDLSPEDCEAHLARRLVQDGQPLIAADIRAAITARSHGLPLHLDLAVSRFLEIRRTGRTPTAADFDCTFPALLARTLSDLTPEERHLLRSVSLLDAFDLELATRTAGLTQQALARRLVERPLVTENPYALWPYHLHRAIRSAVRDDEHSDDRWTPADWHQAATRALAALGDQWTKAAALAPSRMLLVACLRQGLRLARDHGLTGLGWLIEAAFVYTDDSVWEPLALAADTEAPDTPADAVAELLTAIARRQREHRQRTADRLTAVLDTGLLPAELTEMALYYRAKAHKDLSQNDAARTGMQQVADADGRLAVKARRALANLARLAGDFPTALAAVPTLGWKGRHHRVLGDIHWSQADTASAVAAFEAGRAEAEQHGAAGERAMMQVRLALAVSFADPARAADELALAHQLLDGLDQRSNTLLAQVVALIKDAGTSDVTTRAESLRTDIEAAGLPFLHRFVELALAFHHAARDEDPDLAATIDRLRTLTATGDFAYFTDIAHFMAGLPLPELSTTRWTRSEDDVRSAWRGLVQARQEHLLAGN